MVLRSNRLEWIYLLYLLFFVLAILSPSLYTHGYLGLSQTTLEEVTIFAFGMAGLLTFTMYERLMERREHERDQAETDYKRAKGELIESYAYIGSINRKIELLKKMANDTSLKFVGSKQATRDIFQALAANACSVAGAHSVLLRFVELDRLRTEREFGHHADTPTTFRVSNKDLKLVHEQGLNHAFLRSEDGREVLVVPSDRQGQYKAYMMLSWQGKEMPELDTSLLKVFANQAEMLYHHFAGGEHERETMEPVVALAPSEQKQ
jgi:hypothetical protein